MGRFMADFALEYEDLSFYLMQFNAVSASASCGRESGNCSKTNSNSPTCTSSPSLGPHIIAR